MAVRAAAAAGQIDLRRANLGGRHVDALAGGEALGLAHGIGRDHAVGRAVRRDRAFLVTGDHAGAGEPRDCAGGILGGFDGRLGGNAGFVADILDPRAGALEIGADPGRLFVEPVRDIAEQATPLGRGARLSARSCANASEAASRIAPAPTHASSKEAAGRPVKYFETRWVLISGQIDVRAAALAALPIGICAGERL